MQQGKKAIVIGASSGIGLEVAKLLVNQGWIVGVAARRTELLQGIGAAIWRRIPRWIWRRLTLTIVLTALLPCPFVSAQSLQPDTHRIDSLMKSMEYRFGNRKPWLKMNMPDSLQSVVVMKPNKSMVVNPNANKFTMTTKYYPQSVFSRKDDIMFYKDYGWGNFVSDILFGW